MATIRVKRSIITILSIGTAVPEHFFSQSALADHLIDVIKAEETAARQVRKIFSAANIQKRHLMIHDFNAFSKNPGTLTRNQLYTREAPLLAKQAAEAAIQKWGGNHRETISHVISISCTGMYAPGIECTLIDALNLPSNVQRYGINFMGCFGAFRGLALAKAIIAENPNHRVLLVSVELCSLHFQLAPTIENFVINALFGDGAAAAIIGGHPTDQETPLFSIEKSTALVLKGTKDEMSWEVGDHGNLMKLTKKVPRAIQESIEPFITSLLPEKTVLSECHLAVHPGGPSILKSIEKACALSPETLTNSWDVLKNYGNMSSATYLFVLEKALEIPSKKWCIGLGLGPGLSFEGMLLKKC